MLCLPSCSNSILCVVPKVAIHHSPIKGQFPGTCLLKINSLSSFRQPCVQVLVFFVDSAWAKPLPFYWQLHAMYTLGLLAQSLEPCADQIAKVSSTHSGSTKIFCGTNSSSSGQRTWEHEWTEFHKIRWTNIIQYKQTRCPWHLHVLCQPLQNRVLACL